MDDYRDRFHAGRRDMINAFAALTALARQAGVDAEAITAIHGWFFDGNVAIKESFWLAVVLGPDALETARPKQARNSRNRPPPDLSFTHDLPDHS